MSAMSELFAKTNAFVDKLKVDAEHLVPEFQTLIDELLGHVGADASQLATDAEAAAAPVVAEAESDVAALGESAVAAGEQLAQTAAADVSPQSAAAAAPTTLATGGPSDGSSIVLVGESGPELEVPPATGTVAAPESVPEA